MGGRQRERKKKTADDLEDHEDGKEEKKKKERGRQSSEDLQDMFLSCLVCFRPTHLHSGVPSRHQATHTPIYLSIYLSV